MQRVSLPIIEVYQKSALPAVWPCRRRGSSDQMFKPEVGCARLCIGEWRIGFGADRRRWIRGVRRCKFANIIVDGEAAEVVPQSNQWPWAHDGQREFVAAQEGMLD